MPNSAVPAPGRGLRVGLFGGTFNPVHRGHVAIAEDALRLFGLDEVWLLPAAVPPLKPTAGLASNADRLAMLERALAEHGDPRLKACDIEYGLPPPSYTIRTVLALQDRFPETSFSFIVGADSLTTLHLWHRVPELLELLPFLVLARPGYEPTEGDIHLPPPYPARLLANLRTATLSPAASSAIREELARTRTSAHLAPSVLEYVRAHGLYLGARSAPGSSGAGAGAVNCN